MSSARGDEPLCLLPQRERPEVALTRSGLCPLLSPRTSPSWASMNSLAFYVPSR